MKLETKANVYFHYKDRVFRLLFKDKRRLLELYNALNGTDYDNADELVVNTLENAIYVKMKNDVSFVVESNMCLYEHQSSYCPNMPLRGFFYFADLYKKWLGDKDLSVRKHVKIPTPHYVVFYNGMEKKKERFEQKLSSAFEDGKEGCIELTVENININFGHNRELLEKCPTLYGYAYFIATVRRNVENMELREAVERAVDECIRQGILKEFLLEQKAEVVAMSIYEYNEEYVRKVMHEDGYIKAKVEDILEILAVFGEVSQELQERIEEEEDMEVLRKWHKIAIKSSSVEEFEALTTM